MGTLLVLVSLMFATRGGLMFLDVVDYFANNFGLIVIALVEIVTVGLILRRLPMYQNHANFVSDIKLGTFWRVSLLVITPIMLGYMLIDGTIQNIQKNYGDYPTQFVVTYGWALAAAFLVIALIISLKNGMHKYIQILPSLKKNGKIEVFRDEWISNYDDGDWNCSHLGRISFKYFKFI